MDVCACVLWLIGIQRPLKDINVLTDSIYIPKGINIPSLDRTVKWEFQPVQEFKVYHSDQLLDDVKEMYTYFSLLLLL